MNETKTNLETLQDIKQMMERSSRFISLSGLSGIFVGVWALIGAGLAQYKIVQYYAYHYAKGPSEAGQLKNELLVIAGFVFMAALITATLFTYYKSKKQQVPLWGSAAKRLLWNTMIPMLGGAFFLWRMMTLHQYDLIASGCLIFYGLALVNGSKYTMGEVKFLGYAEIILGVLNLWLYRQGLLCWAIGFGLFHIIYGAAMWWKYDRQHNPSDTSVDSFKMEA